LDQAAEPVTIPPTAGVTVSKETATERTFGRGATGSALTIDYTRRTIEDPTISPFVTHGRVFTTMPGGLLGSCSGTLVNSANKSVVMTAAHCILNPKVSGFVTSLTFVPGYNGGKAPFGKWAARYVAVTPQWANSLSSGGDSRYDVGAAVLATDSEGRAAADVFGARGVLFNADPLQSFTSFGYPAVAPFDGRHLISCESEPGDFLAFWGAPYPAAMGCDMTPGSSGGGWVVRDAYLNSVVSFSLLNRPEVQYGPYFGDAALKVYETAESQPVPGVTPEPSATEGPAPAEHPIMLGLRLRRHLVARGRMGAPDGYLPCTRNAPVSVYRMAAGEWKLLGITRTNEYGVYRLRLPDRQGRYRADSPSGRVNENNLCSSSASIVRRHRH
jgi:V8-like Glu-specific endopeptidase